MSRDGLLGPEDFDAWLASIRPAVDKALGVPPTSRRSGNRPKSTSTRAAAKRPAKRTSKRS